MTLVYGFDADAKRSMCLGVVERSRASRYVSSRIGASTPPRSEGLASRFRAYQPLKSLIKK